MAELIAISCEEQTHRRARGTCTCIIMYMYMYDVSIYFHVHTKHTLQSFHNLILSYAPKRIGYKHDAYVARVQLAFIDHNKHLNRPQLKTRDGKLVYTRKWGRRTSKWQVVPIPVSKTYSYMPGMVHTGYYVDTPLILYFFPQNL